MLGIAQGGRRWRRGGGSLEGERTEEVKRGEEGELLLWKVGGYDGR